MHAPFTNATCLQRDLSSHEDAFFQITPKLKTYPRFRLAFRLRPFVPALNTPGRRYTDVFARPGSAPYTRTECTLHMRTYPCSRQQIGTYMMSVCGRTRTHNSSRTPRSAAYWKHPSRAYHTYHNATLCFLRDASNGCASREPMPDSERPRLRSTCARPYRQFPVWETRMLHSSWLGSGIGPNTRAKSAKRLLQTNFVCQPHLTPFKGGRHRP